MSKTAANKPNVVGLDIGYSNVKMAYGDSKGEPKVMIRPAQAAPLSHIHGDDLNRPGEYRVDVGGEPWMAFVDPGRTRMKRELHADYPSTEAYKALFHAALIAACEEGRVVDHLVTGLPVNQARDAQLVDALKSRLLGVHQVAPKTQIEVKNVTVVPQPVGTLYDIYSTHDDADMFDESKVLILDPGFFSVDWVLFQNGVLNKDSSETALEAMSRMIQAINDEIRADFGGQGPGFDKTEIALQTGKETVVMHGERLALKEYIDRAKAKVAPDALKTLHQKMRFIQQDSLDFILLGGGGAELYKEGIQALYPKARIITSQEPALSNARGFWLHGVQHSGV